MLTVLRSGPYRFSFTPEIGTNRRTFMSSATRTRLSFGYSLSLSKSNTGFGRGELMNIYRLISENQQLLWWSWHDYFGD